MIGRRAGRDGTTPTGPQREDGVQARRPGRRATAPAGPPRDGAPVARQTVRVSDSLDAALATLTEPAPAGADGRGRPALDLLIWDAPNIDMTLSTVIGARPTAASRPRFDAIAAWFVEGAGDPALPDAPDVEACVFANIPPQPGTLQRWVEALRGFGFAVFARPTAASRPRFDAIAAWFVEGAGDPEAPDAPEVEACVFANIPPNVGSLQRWVEALRGFGFAVFARPKTAPDDDIDQAMLDHIDVRRHSHRLRRLIVFSGDGRNFAEPLEELARAGTHVVVVAFSEVAGYAITSDLLEFIDIEDVPGAFTEPLDRVRLDALPPGGAWLRPTRSLREFVASYAARRNA